MVAKNNLTACIICSDEEPKDRVHKFVKLLLESQKFDEVYTLKSETDKKKFILKDISNICLVPSLSKDEFPQQVTVVFLHDSDTIKLWQPLWIQHKKKANFIFKFSTPGDPVVQGEELPIYRKNKGDDFCITANDIEEVVAYITKQRSQEPSMCFPTWELCQSLEPNTLEKRKKYLSLLSSLLNHYESRNKDYYQSIYRLMGEPKPIIYVLDDYNNYIICEEGIWKPNSVLEKDETVAKYYCENQEKINEFYQEILSGFCLMLNSLSLAFTIKAPPLWIPNTQAGYDLVSSALPLPQLDIERSEIAAFIVDLEWLPTLTDYRPMNQEKKQQWKKMGRLAIALLSQFYPEIPAFIFTGLQPAEELQDGLSRGAFWGFQKEQTHHYSPQQQLAKPLTEQLTYINLKRQLTRVVDVCYSSYQEVPFPNQLKLDPAVRASQQLIQQLGIEQPVDQCFKGKGLQKIIAGLLPTATSVQPIKVLTTGKSRTQATFFVSPTSEQDKLATRFIKIGPWLSVQKEYQAYKTVIHPRLNSYTANLIHKLILVEGELGQMPKGALMYSLAGFPEDYQNLRSLDELFEQQIEKLEGGKFLCECVQNTLEKVLLPLYQAGISKPLKQQPLWCWLGDALPPLYTGILIPLPLTSQDNFDEQTTTATLLSSQSAQGYKDTAAWMLASFALTQLNSKLENQKQGCQLAGVPEDPSHWDDEMLDKPYQPVLLSGWHLVAIDWEEINSGNGTVTLVHPDLGMRVLLRGRSEDIRLRFGATWLRPGVSVKVLAYLDVKNQELERIRRKIQENFCSLNWLIDVERNQATDVFECVLNDFKTANKLERSLTSPFDVFGDNSRLPHHYTMSGRAGSIHGDLNLNNILYAANETVGWLIDFELVKEQGAIAFDLAKLEVEIWNHHFFPYLATVATLSSSPPSHSCYQLLYWCLQALDFPGCEGEFFMTKLRSAKEFAVTSDALFISAINTLKIIKTIRRFGLEQCQLTPGELKWALASYSFNTVKFSSQTKKFKTFSGCTAIFSFLASAWHLEEVLPRASQF